MADRLARPCPMRQARTSRSRRWRPSSSSELPAQGGWRYEPKWDGFRGVLENDGGELALWSRNGRPLLRYFPELRERRRAPAAALRARRRDRDRARRASSTSTRCRRGCTRPRAACASCPAEIPATFVAFDLLLWKGKPVHEQPIEKRRARAREGRERDPALAGDATTSSRGATWLADAAGRRLRRRDREEARAAVPARLARRRRQGEAVQDGRLRRRRRALQGGRPHDDRDAAARAVRRRRRTSTTSARPRSARSSTTRSRRSCCRCSTRRATAASRSRTAGAPASSRSRR